MDIVHVTKGMISPWYHLDNSEEDWVILWFYLPETENSFLQETRIGIQLFEYLLRTNQVNIKIAIG